MEKKTAGSRARRGGARWRRLPVKAPGSEKLRKRTVAAATPQAPKAVERAFPVVGAGTRRRGRPDMERRAIQASASALAGAKPRRGGRVDEGLRARAERMLELQTLNATLEERIRQGTADFVAAKERLRAEIAERRRTEAALRESEERLRAVLETAPDGIITIDQSGVIETVNPAAERMFGYDAGEMIGRNVAMLMPSPYREEHYSYLKGYLETGEKRIIGSGREVVGLRKDGSAFPMDLAVSVSRDGGARFTGVVRDVTERRRLQRAVADRVMEEQQAIARELHDGVAQRLTGVEMMASVLKEKLRESAPPDEAEAFSRLVGQIRQAQDQLRQVVKGIYRFSVPADGLEAALRDLARSTESLHGLRCTFECSGQALVPEAGTATQLFFIAREAVHNAVRHAAAKRIAVGLEADRRALLLTIRDDGKGVDRQALDGMGTQIMRYRASLIGATVDIRRARGGGTLVACTIGPRPDR